MSTIFGLTYFYIDFTVLTPLFSMEEVLNDFKHVSVRECTLREQNSLLDREIQQNLALVREYYWIDRSTVSCDITEIVHE